MSDPSDVDETVAPLRAESTSRFGFIVLLTAACWALALPVFTLAFVNNYLSYEVNFIHGLYERKHVAAERAAPVGGQRLLIVGGSGALFGIDAEVLGAKLGIPVINFGTHAGLGGEYILGRARRELRRGDRVLLCLEYELMTPPPAGDAFNRFGWDFAISYDKRFLFDSGILRSAASLYSVPLNDYLFSGRGWSRYRKGRHRVQYGPYNLALLSPAGDVRRVTQRRPLPQGVANPLDGLNDLQHQPHLRAFAAFARANANRVYFTWPNLCRPDGWPGTDLHRPHLTEALTQLGFELLDEPHETMYPREWYLDTIYHLDACARRIRTEALARRIGGTASEVKGYYIVSGGEHLPCPGNIFADQPGIHVKYLVSTPLDHPDAISAEQLRKLCESGLPVYFDDPRLAGADDRIVAQTTEHLRDWLARYVNHVFLIAGGGADPGAEVPQDVRVALRDHALVAAAFGSGRFSAIRRIAVGERRAAFDGWLTELTGADGPELRMLIDADAASHKPFRISLNRDDLAGDGRGPHVVVIDPVAGIVVNSASFSDPAGTVTWRLFRYGRPAK